MAAGLDGKLPADSRKWTNVVRGHQQDAGPAQCRMPPDSSAEDAAR